MWQLPPDESLAENPVIAPVVPLASRTSPVKTYSHLPKWVYHVVYRMNGSQMGVALGCLVTIWCLIKLIVAYQGGNWHFSPAAWWLGIGLSILSGVAVWWRFLRTMRAVQKRLERP